jgi:hypothetical protein
MARCARPSIEVSQPSLGWTMFRGSRAELGIFIAEETEKWGKVIKFAGIKPQ